MTSNSKMPSVERKIYFFRSDQGSDDAGQPMHLDPPKTLASLQGLPFTNDRVSRYESEPDGNVLCVIVESQRSLPSIRFCRVRRTALPQIERQGRVGGLGLDENSGLLESTHVVFFPSGIVGAEYNHFGPRLSRLGGYIDSKSDGDVPRTVFRSLLRGDSSDQLERLEDLRLFEMNIVPSIVSSVANIDQSLHDAFEANRKILENPKVVQVVLKPDPRASRGFWSKMQSTLRALLMRHELRDGIQRMHAKGRCEDTKRVESLDLLNDHLISVKRIVKMDERSRALDSTSAFDAIESSYEELARELETAAGVSSLVS